MDSIKYAIQLVYLPIGWVNVQYAVCVGIRAIGRLLIVMGDDTLSLTLPALLIVLSRAINDLSLTLAGPSALELPYHDLELRGSITNTARHSKPITHGGTSFTEFQNA
jgi:hypothetical protein